MKRARLFFVVALVLLHLVLVPPAPLLRLFPAVAGAAFGAKGPYASPLTQNFASPSRNVVKGLMTGLITPLTADTSTSIPSAPAR